MENIFGLLLTLLLGLFILLGSLIAFISKNNKKIVDLSIGIAFGVMSMLIIFDLLPESIEIFKEIYNRFIPYVLVFIGALVGILMLKVFDIFIPDHEEGKEEDKLHHIGIISTIALVLHNIIEGMAVYSVYNSSPKTALLLSIGVGLHNLPLGMIITLLLYKDKGDKKKAIISTSLLALSTFLGGLLMFLLEGMISNFALGVLLSLTTGMIIYIIFFELLPRIIETKNKKLNILGILIGIVLILISLLF